MILVTYHIMNKYDYLTSYKKACSVFFRYLRDFIDTHIIEYKELLNGKSSVLWEKKYSQYDGVFFGGIATITIDGSKNVPNTIFKFHQIIYGPVISTDLYYKIMKGNQIKVSDILENIINNNIKKSYNEYNKFRFPKMYQFIGLLDTPFQSLQLECLEKGFFLINETSDNDVSIRLKLYTYRPYIRIQSKLLWHGQNCIPVVKN
jgi:hypothetical protein